MAGGKAVMKETKKRTLYECAHARVKGDVIYCAKGYPFSQRPGNGHVDITRLASGKRLAYGVCQDCGDFECNGEPVPPEDRGWLEKEMK
jgi:hypothetical protein